MSLKDELKKLIAVERDRLAWRDSKRAEVAAQEAERRTRQAEIFAPVAKALTELRDAVAGNDGVQVTLFDTCALVSLDVSGDGHGRQELEINTKYTSWSGRMHCDDDGYVVRSMVSDFPAEDIEDFAHPDRREFDSAAELTDWLSQKVAKTVAARRHHRSMRSMV